MMYMGITMAHHRAALLESGSSRAVHTRSKILSPRRWNRLRNAALTTCFSEDKELGRPPIDDLLLPCTPSTPPKLFEELLALPGMTWISSPVIDRDPMPPVIFSSLALSGARPNTAPSAVVGISSLLGPDIQERVLIALLKAPNFASIATLSSCSLPASSCWRLGTLRFLNFAPPSPAIRLSNFLLISASSWRTSRSNQETRGC
mmetsp:Transcript_50694/g.157197  ORF Transcript_50694/g.157197 Transcript_50694/m.157197 type:complete len:204 (+) Transcript_50694:141-752(+)